MLVVLVVLVALVVVLPVVLVVLAVLLPVLLVSLALLVVEGVTVSVLPGLSGLSLRLVVVHCGWSGLRLRMLGSPVRARLLLRGQASWRLAVVAVV